MGSKGLHTEQLEFLLTHLVQQHAADRKVSSLGVFPADCIPSLKAVNHNACFIVNTDPNGEPGKHWLAFFYDFDNRTLEYFDSFALKLNKHKYVHSTLSSRKLDILPVNNTVNLQSFNSSVCGFYCILYLHWRTRFNDSYLSITKIRKLSNIDELRDLEVVDTVHKIMHKHNCPILPKTFTRLSQSSCPLSMYK
jgi:hypothetical protein